MHTPDPPPDDATAAVATRLPAEQGASDVVDEDWHARIRRLNRLRGELEKVIRGKSDVIESVLIALVGGGSILLEDVPGVGKTTLAKSIAALFDLDFKRVQCTPDLLPADILGGSVFQPATNSFEFRPGPIFCDLMIADEINRASPRTQSALLEAMAESQVTIDGKRYNLKQPFLVIATQNPCGFEGTFPLPESQLDRFLLRLSMDYPDAESEIELLIDEPHADQNTLPPSMMDRDDLLALQAAAARVVVDRKVATYAVEFVTETRRDSRIAIGCSPRGAKMWLQAARAKALLEDRDYVLPDDLQGLAPMALSHRIALATGFDRGGQGVAIIEDLIGKVEVPM